ncbi:MAG: tRNA pseudouridine(38-40) synthase TruA [Salinivirgaceae bacterium]|nr:tRNA pseudouridine(38-40) synthase TruA [Salinivirgaceae bacterium]
MSTRYFIKLDYNGSKFHGWQIQPNATTVQEWINKALSNILKEGINVVGCGRTDTGVHARNFYAHFDSDSEYLQDDSNLVYKLNRFIPKEILVYKIIKVKQASHSRFDATSRTYNYYITQNKDPFYYMYSHQVNGDLDIDLMNDAAKKLLNYTDFTSFSKVDTDVKTNNCKITEAQWAVSLENIVFTITADRFLRNMIRAIVGTLLDVGRKKLTIADFCTIIEAKDRCQAGSSAPGNALFLVNVKYPYDL